MHTLLHFSVIGVNQGYIVEIRVLFNLECQNKLSSDFDISTMPKLSSSNCVSTFTLIDVKITEF